MLGHHCPMSQLKHAVLGPAWGSMTSGHLWLLVMRMPFCREKVPAGRPCRFHCRTVAGSAKKLDRSRVAEAGICSCCICISSPDTSPIKTYFFMRARSCGRQVDGTHPTRKQCTQDSHAAIMLSPPFMPPQQDVLRLSNAGVRQDLGTHAV